MSNSRDPASNSQDHQRKIALVSNTAWSIYNFRKGLIAELQNCGYGVFAIAPADGHEADLIRIGCRFFDIPLDGRGKNFFKDLWTLWSLFHIFHRNHIDTAFHFTIKPNIYGSLACLLLGIDAYPTVTGMGNVFTRESMTTRLVRCLYRLIFRHLRHIFFQNRNDRDYFLLHALVREEQVELLPGSGVDTTYFAPVPSDTVHSGFVFLFIARLLWEKGVAEYVEAARRIRAERMDVEFHVLGFVEQGDDAVPMECLQAWEKEGAIRFLGASDQVRSQIALADCIVLPSYYREGVPRVLLEAASMAKPVITTDSVGCREAVVDGRTGFLCKPRDAADLAAKMQRMLLLGDGELREMGSKGRERMVAEFDEKIVRARYREVLGDW